MILQTILIGCLYLITSFEPFFGTSLIGRAIICGPLTGLIMGDMQAGIIMGGTLELAFIGAVSIGAYDPPDVASGTILGTAFAMQAGAGPEVALALGLPISTIMQTVVAICWGLFPTIWMHRADTQAAKGNVKGVEWNMFWAGTVPILVTFWIVPAAFYFGNDAIVSLLGVIPDFIVTGMDIAAGVIPAIGFAMLAQMIMNRKVAPYFFIGYFMVQYIGVTTTGIAIFAILIAFLVVSREGKQKETEVVGDDF